MYVVYMMGSKAHFWTEGQFPSWSWTLPALSCGISASFWLVPGTYADLNNTAP